MWRPMVANHASTADAQRRQIVRTYLERMVTFRGESILAFRGWNVSRIEVKDGRVRVVMNHDEVVSVEAIADVSSRASFDKTNPQSEIERLLEEIDILLTNAMYDAGFPPTGPPGTATFRSKGRGNSKYREYRWKRE